ncbi:MAG: immunoglobulin-like domain-containing protein [Clostridia bacterium]
MKKIISLSLAFIMMMALAACNDTPASDGGLGDASGTTEDISVESGEHMSGGADMLEVDGHMQSDEMESTQQATTQQNWGITFTASDVTPTGLTLICEQADGEQQGELMTGSLYWLQVYENSRWEEVDYIVQEVNIGWTSEGWMIFPNEKNEWEVDWEWLYGELPTGTYRIGKSVMDLIEAGNYEEQTYYVEFEIE